MPILDEAAKTGALNYTLPHNRTHILERLYKTAAIPSTTGRKAAEIYTKLT